MHVLNLPADTPLSRGQQGFTAIELMVVVSIVAILAALAAPSFTPLIERWRVRSAIEDLTSTLYFARSEAIKRGGGITIDASSGWNQGWKVTHTLNGITTDLQYSAAPTKVNIDHSNIKSKIYVDPWGVFSETSGGVSNPIDIVFYPENKSSTDSSAVRLCALGSRITQIKQGLACP